MSEHRASIRWSPDEQPFTFDTYTRAFTLDLGSGQSVPASSAPEYKGDASRANPEELLVGALAGCHMLTFLAVAARKRLAVVGYEDDAVGVLGKNAEGRLAVTHVTLRPKVVFAEGTTVAPETLTSIHDLAHKNCFIASSVRCDVSVEPR